MQTASPHATIPPLPDLLAQDRSLRIIDGEVDPGPFMAMMAEEEQKKPDGGAPLLFTSVRGGSVPVGMNLFGSMHRICRFLGVDGEGDLPALTGRFFAGGGSFRPIQVAPPSRFSPRGNDIAPLPPLVSWRGDGAPHTCGAAYTLAVSTFLDPETDHPTIGIYRIIRFSDSHLGICWKEGSSGERAFRWWRRRRLPMPLLLLFAPPPAVIVAASLTLPLGVEKLELAGGWAGGPIPLFPAPETGLPIPLGTPLVVEGVVDPEERRPGGGYYNHTGLFEKVGTIPLFRVLSLSMGEDPILPQTVVAPPPTESTTLARAGWRLILPLIQREFPEIVDIHLPVEGIWHGAVFISLSALRESGREILQALWRSPFFSRSRLLLLLDENTPPDDFSRIFWQVMNRCVMGRDLVIADPGDPASPWGGKIGIDARGLPRERT